MVETEQERPINAPLTLPAAKNKGDYMKRWCTWNICAILAAGAVVFGSPAYASQSESPASHDGTRGLGSIQGKTLSVEINSDGSYAIMQAGIPGAVMRS